MRTRHIATAAVAALLITAAPISVVALDLGGTVKKVTKKVSNTLPGGGGSSGSGGSATGGTSSSSSSGSTSSGGSTSGGGSGLGVEVPLLGGNNLSVKLLDGSGVASVGVENGRTGTNILSGFQLSSLGLDPGTTAQLTTAGGAITVAFARALYESLDRLERQVLATRCGSVLHSPKAFDDELVQLCRILGSL
jgi:hypothetical protein